MAVRVVSLVSILLPVLLLAPTGVRGDSPGPGGKAVVVQAGRQIGGITAISPDGELIANCGAYGALSGRPVRTVTLWNSRGTLLRTLRRSFDMSFRRLCFDPGNRLLACSGLYAPGDSCAVELMDLRGEGTAVLRTPRMATDAEGLFSPDGRTVAVSYADRDGAPRLAVFDVSGRLLSDGPIPLAGRPSVASYAADGRSLLLVLGGGTAAAVDVATRAARRLYDASGGERLEGLAAAPDGRIALALVSDLPPDPKEGPGAPDRRSERVLLLSPTGAPEGSLGPMVSGDWNPPVQGMAFLPDGNLLLSLLDRTAKVEGTRAAYSYGHRIPEWPRDGGEPRIVSRGASVAGTPAAAADGRFAAPCSDALVLFGADGARRAVMGSAAVLRRSLAVSPDGGFFVAGPGPCEVWSFDGRLVSTVAFPEGRAPFLVSFAARDRILGLRFDGCDLYSTEGAASGRFDAARGPGMPAVGGRFAYFPVTEAGGVLLDTGTWERRSLETDGGDVAISPGGARIAVAGRDGCQILDAEGGEVADFSFPEMRMGPVAVADNGDCAWCGRTDDGFVVRHRRASVGILLGCKVDGDPGSYAMAAITAQGDLVAAATSDSPVIYGFDPRTDGLRRWEGHDGGLTALCFSPDGGRLVSASIDGTIRIWNRADGRSIGLASSGADWVAFGDDGYFDASPSGGRLLAVVSGLEAYAVDQEAVLRNRPDLLLERAGLAGPEEVSYYRGRYIQRLVKSEAFPPSIPKAVFEERILPGAASEATRALLALYRASGQDYRLDRDAPVDARYASLAAPSYLSLVEEYLGKGRIPPSASILSTEQDGSGIRMEARLSAPEAGLARWQVYVDDEPLFPGRGRTVSGTEAVVKERLGLPLGNAKVEVSCFDAVGAESARSSAALPLRAQPAAPPPRGRLFFLGFGVSAYDDPALRLLYPRKDVEDLAAAFSSMGAGYDAIVVKCFVDAACDRASFAEAKAILEATRPEDTAIVFVSGHGVHDRDAAATYYFLTREADLERLPVTAADFTLVEGLLDGIAAMRKVLLMDTCESGDYEGAPVPSDGAGSRGVRARSLPRAARGLSVAAAVPARAYARDRFINGDVFRRTGAIVFSSSRGGEPSYEPAEVRPDGNGFFTAAVLRALGSMEADADGDGRISVAELRAFVSASVAARTEGRQHPTVDRDNLTIRFSFPLPDGSLAATDPGVLRGYLASVARGGDAQRLAAVLVATGNPGPEPLSAALLAAAQAGRDACVRLLLTQGADPGSRDAAGESAASLAVRAGDEEASLAIVEAGAEVPPSLLAAAGADMLDAVAALLRRGWKIERADREDALWEAVRGGRLPAVRLLVEAGVALMPDLDAPPDMRPAAMARAFGSPDVADYLEAMEEGCGKLREAARAGDGGEVARLLAAGVPVRTSLESLPLVAAAAEGRTGVVGLLLEGGAEIDAVSPWEGWTALMAAVAWDRLETVRFLLEAGADPDVRGETGRSARDMAREDGHEEAAALLRERGGR